MYILWLVFFCAFCIYTGYSVRRNKKHEKAIDFIVGKITNHIDEIEIHIKQQTEISAEKAKRDVDEYIEKQSKIIAIRAKLEAEGSVILDRITSKNSSFSVEDITLTPNEFPPNND